MKTKTRIILLIVLSLITPPILTNMGLERWSFNYFLALVGISIFWGVILALLSLEKVEK